MNTEYRNWITEVKAKVRSSQIKAAVAVNTALIEFYWDLGKMLSEKESVWGRKLVENVARDLKMEFPDMQGLSRRNLFNAKKFFQFYDGKLVQQPVALITDLAKTNDSQRTLFVHQVVGQIPWGHNILIFTKSKDIQEALFYVQKTKENNWSRDVLALQIKSNLYQRSGKAITNFTHTLPAPSSDLAQQTLKDPYVFDFLHLAEDYKERDIENQLIKHITRFLLELGKGFAFIGRQYNIQLNKKEYFIDLLFYHIPMQCYVVVELKNKDFEPEFAGKLNFYLTLIDKTLKRPNENPTIGILLCKGKDNLEVEYALQDIHKPMGVSEFELFTQLPDNLKSSLPTIEEIEEQLKIDHNEGS